jgi:hypothetical protein
MQSCSKQKRKEQKHKRKILKTKQKKSSENRHALNRTYWILTRNQFEGKKKGKKQAKL